MKRKTRTGKGRKLRRDPVVAPGKKTSSPSSSPFASRHHQHHQHHHRHHHNKKPVEISSKFRRNFDAAASKFDCPRRNFDAPSVGIFEGSASKFRCAFLPMSSCFIGNPAVLLHILEDPRRNSDARPSKFRCGGHRLRRGGVEISSKFRRNFDAGASKFRRNFDGISMGRFGAFLGPLGELLECFSGPPWNKSSPGPRWAARAPPGHTYGLVGPSRADTPCQSKRSPAGPVTCKGLRGPPEGHRCHAMLCHASHTAHQITQNGPSGAPGAAKSEEGAPLAPSTWPNFWRICVTMYGPEAVNVDFVPRRFRRHGERRSESEHFHVQALCRGAHKQ